MSWSDLNGVIQWTWKWKKTDLKHVQVCWKDHKKKQRKLTSRPLSRHSRSQKKKQISSLRQIETYLDFDYKTQPYFCPQTKNFIRLFLNKMNKKSSTWYMIEFLRHIHWKTGTTYKNTNIFATYIWKICQLMAFQKNFLFESPTILHKNTPKIYPVTTHSVV